MPHPHFCHHQPTHVPVNGTSTGTTITTHGKTRLTKQMLCVANYQKRHKTLGSAVSPILSGCTTCWAIRDPYCQVLCQSKQCRGTPWILWLLILCHNHCPCCRINRSCSGTIWPWTLTAHLHYHSQHPTVQLVNTTQALFTKCCTRNILPILTGTNC